MPEALVKFTLASLLLAGLAACGTVPGTADPDSDAPEGQGPPVAAFKDAASYSEALQVWRTPEHVNDWIGARFHYDTARSLRLSETQRSRSASPPIHPPHEFFAAPSGMCVDLSRFAVETLRRIDPDAQARYLMIEFSPVTVRGNTLRRHWLAAFTRDGQHYFFADSKRPGHLAGPYASAEAFVAEYSTYRNRPVVAFRELDSFQRKLRMRATKQHREESRP